MARRTRIWIWGASQDNWPAGQECHQVAVKTKREGKSYSQSTEEEFPFSEKAFKFIGGGQASRCRAGMAAQETRDDGGTGTRWHTQVVPAQLSETRWPTAKISAVAQSSARVAAVRVASVDVAASQMRSAGCGTRAHSGGRRAKCLGWTSPCVYVVR